MAEFTEVMRAAQRMCDAQKTCRECNLGGRHGCAFDVVECVDYAAVERDVMLWAQAHPEPPEPAYPSWYDWQRENFPCNTRYICPMAFGVTCPAPSVPNVWVCEKCRSETIPAEIAARLGIQAMNGGGKHGNDNGIEG